jgi:hypothetical protein
MELGVSSSDSHHCCNAKQEGGIVKLERPEWVVNTSTSSVANRTLKSVSTPISIGAGATDDGQNY